MTALTPTMQALDEGLWAYVQPDGGWMVNNMGVVELGDSVLSIDVTSTEKRTRAYLNAVCSAAGKPVSRLVLTHAHPDHCNGASLLPGVEVVAHRNVAAELAAHRPAPDGVFTPFEVGDAHPVAPHSTYTDRLTLQADGRAVHVVHPGRTAHTSGDSYVWVPDARVLYAGDLVFNGGTPFAMSGSVPGWLATLAELRALDPAVVVPGHGPVGGPGLLDAVEDYLLFLRRTAEDSLAAGLTPLEAARRTDLGRFAALLEPERLVGNLHRAYADLTGRTVNPATVFQEMVEYNDGNPLTCHA